MFNFFKERDNRNVAEKYSALYKGVDQNSLTDKPFIAALLSIAAREQDDTARVMAGLLGSDPDNELPKDLDKIVSSALDILVISIVLRAQSDLNRLIDAGENFGVLEKAIPVAFGIFVTASAIPAIANEGIEISITDKIIPISSSLAPLLDSDEDKVIVMKKGFELFQTLAKTDHEKFHDWRKNLRNAVLSFVLNEKIKKTDESKFHYLFKDLLNALYIVCEPG